MSSRATVILHERIGNWSAQLRQRLHDRPIHWMETRSKGDLGRAVRGVARPIVVHDLRRNVVEGLRDLLHLMQRAPDARVLVLDPDRHEGVCELARELGATHVVSGFVPPPDVAELIDRWIALTLREIPQQGWSHTAPINSPLNADEWIASILGDDPFADVPGGPG